MVFQPDLPSLLLLALLLMRGCIPGLGATEGPHVVFGRSSHQGAQNLAPD